MRVRPARARRRARHQRGGDRRRWRATSRCWRRPRWGRRPRAATRDEAAPRRCPTSATRSPLWRAAACAERVPALVATMLGAMAQPARARRGGWQAEWETLSDLLRLVGSAAAALREAPRGARARPRADAREPRPDRRPADGRERGHRARAESSGARPPTSCWNAPRGGRWTRAAPSRDVLIELPEVTDALGEQGLDEALAPEGYLGVAGKLIDRALARAPVLMAVELHHTLNGPPDAPVVVLSNSLGTSLRDVGAAVPGAVARASACCATTSAGTAARPCRRGRTTSRSSAATCSRCWTGSRSSAPRSAASRWAA